MYNLAGRAERQFKTMKTHEIFNIIKTYGASKKKKKKKESAKCWMELMLLLENLLYCWSCAKACCWCQWNESSPRFLPFAKWANPAVAEQLEIKQFQRNSDSLILWEAFVDIIWRFMKWKLLHMSYYTAWLAPHQQKPWKELGAGEGCPVTSSKMRFAGQIRV